MTGHKTKYLTICKQIVLDSLDKSEYAVFLFGSRATGNGSKHSDIDIGILGKQNFDMSKIFQIKNEIEEIKLDRSGIDKEQLDKIKTSIDLNVINVSEKGEKEGDVTVATAAGYIASQ